MIEPAYQQLAASIADALISAGFIGSVGDPKELAAFIRDGDWNEYHLVVRGGVQTHLLNGHVMSVVINDDASFSSSEEGSNNLETQERKGSPGINRAGSANFETARGKQMTIMGGIKSGEVVVTKK